ncbi:MAG: hypothetical protein WCJ53_16500, partial [Mycobacteriaceae bacterium]
DWDWSSSGPVPASGAGSTPAMRCRVAAAGTRAERVAVFCDLCAGAVADADEGFVESGSEGCAEASPGDEATAIPTPRAIASPPTRPM